MTKEVLKQVLEAIKRSDSFLHNWHENHSDDEADHYSIARLLNQNAIKALEEALKQEQGEQLARLGWQEIDCPICGGGARAFPKQEQGEPVAWYYKIGATRAVSLRQENDLSKPWEPLYTTPQQRKPLTDEQKIKIALMFSDRVANECNINAEDHWKLHSVSVLDDINFILQAIQEIKE